MHSYFYFFSTLFSFSMRDGSLDGTVLDLDILEQWAIHCSCCSGDTCGARDACASSACFTVTSPEVPSATASVLKVDGGGDGAMLGESAKTDLRNAAASGTKVLFRSWFKAWLIQCLSLLLRLSRQSIHFSIWAKQATFVEPRLAWRWMLRFAWNLLVPARLHRTRVDIRVALERV